MILVFPICGSGERFRTAGYDVWKPLIPIRGKPMLAWAAERVGGLVPDEILVALPAMVGPEVPKRVVEILIGVFPQTAVRLVPVATPTAGAAETVKIAAQRAVDYPRGMDRPFVVIDCDDTHVPLPTDAVRSAAAGVAVFQVDLERHAPLNRWGYATVHENGTAIHLREKPPSVQVAALALTGAPAALAGVFWWPSTQAYLDAYARMLKTQKPIRGEWYVSQVVQATIDGGTPVHAVHVDDFHCLGTPVDVVAFEAAASHA